MRVGNPTFSKIVVHIETRFTNDMLMAVMK